MTEQYILGFQMDPDYARWVVRCVSGDTPSDGERGEFLAAMPAQFVSDRHAAQEWATGLLYGLQIRAVRWDVNASTADSLDVSYTAVIGEWRRSWEVTEYAGQCGLWRAGANGTWTGPNNARYPDRAALRHDHGPLVPTQVHNLPGLLAELGIYRAVAGYVAGPEECVSEYCCPEYDEAEQAGRPIENCSHVTHHIATADQVYALARVEAALAALTLEASVPDDQAGRYSAGERAELRGVMRAVEAIREARDREDG